MNITIINDCRDANAVGRQITRASALLGGNVSFVGVSSDLEASGNLIDTLDAYGDLPGVVLVNVAPRNGEARRWGNGTPFGYFWYKNVLIITTIDGLTLSLVKKLGLTETIIVLDIPKVLKRFVSSGILSPKLQEYISNSQFRSYDFLPRVAAYLLEKKTLQGEKQKINNFPDAPLAIWWVDNFGNYKTTILKKEIEASGNQIRTTLGKLTYFRRLKDVPDKETALITGSSGINNNRFLEIVVQGGSASKSLCLSSGTLIL